MLLSWYVYFVKGDKLSGLFVGLWPPTFMAFASYFEQTRMRGMVERATGGGSGVVKSLERVIPV